MYCRNPASPVPSLPPGNVALGINGMAGEVFFAAFADRAEAFKHQPERIEPRVAGGAIGIRAMPGQHFAQRQIHLGLVVRQFGHDRRRRRDALAQNIFHHPVAALHGAGAQARRVLGQEHRHRQQPAAIILAGVGDVHPVV